MPAYECEVSAGKAVGTTIIGFAAGRDRVMTAQLTALVLSVEKAAGPFIQYWGGPDTV